MNAIRERHFNAKEALARRQEQKQKELKEKEEKKKLMENDEQTDKAIK